MSNLFSVEVTEAIVSKVDIAGIPAGTALKKLINGGYLLSSEDGSKQVFVSSSDVENGTMFEIKYRIGEASDSPSVGCGDPDCGCAVECETVPAAPIDVPPALNATEVYQSGVFEEIQTAVCNQKAIPLGAKYYFYLVGEKRWAKATMERSSSDIGRLLSGFALPLTTTVKSKKNRLKKLNECYGLDLSEDEIVSIANA